MLRNNEAMDSTILYSIGGAVSGAILALWAVVSKYIGRLEKKQDDGERLREAQGSQIIELITKHSELSGRINGYIEAKKDLKELSGMPLKVEQIHSEVLKITDAVLDNE